MDYLKTQQACVQSMLRLHHTFLTKMKLKNLNEDGYNVRSVQTQSRRGIIGNFITKLTEKSQIENEYVEDILPSFRNHLFQAEYYSE